MSIEKALEGLALQRRPVQYEDQLLKWRSGYILALNALALVAENLSPAIFIRSLIILLIVVIDVFWINYALDASWFIGNLAQGPGRSNAVSEEAPPAEVRNRRLRIRSTTFISFTMPTFLLIGWLVGLFLTVLSY